MVHRPDIYGDTLQWIFADTHTQQTTTISVVDTPVQLNRSTGITTGEQKNMPIDATGIVTCKVAGMFMLQYHCSFSGASNDDFTMYWRINDTNQTSGTTKWTQKGGDKWAISSQTMINLQEGDTIDLYIENNTDTSDIELENFNQTIFKISSSPTTFLFSPAPPPPPDTSFTFSILATGSSFTLPLISDGTIDMEVDWGDGETDTITTYNQPEITHSYASAITYTIKITGTIRGWRFWWGGDVAKMREISNWGDFDFTTYGAFAGASSLTCTATDIPNITGSSLGYSFYSCTNFETDVSGWDTSAITDMNGLFTLCNAFTGVGIDGWDVSNSQGFNAMFVNNSLFNQDISGWDVSSATNLSQMFSGCPLFNQDLNSWDVSSVSNFGSMFQTCLAFNQDLNSWNTSSGTSMADMFYGIAIFNGNITSWDVSNVTNFQNTFNGCTAFDQDLSGWNVTSACTRTIGMFQYATSFDADISGWDVSNVEYFNSMFRGADFNQDIGGWDTSSGLNMSYMFRDNDMFDQDISSWDISNNADFTGFMQGATLSTTNYDALLIAWDGQSVVSGLTINFGSSTYTGGGAVATARANLISSDSWTITDGGIA